MRTFHNCSLTTEIPTRSHDSARVPVRRTLLASCANCATKLSPSRPSRSSHRSGADTHPPELHDIAKRLVDGRETFSPLELADARAPPSPCVAGAATRVHAAADELDRRAAL